MFTKVLSSEKPILSFHICGNDLYTLSGRSVSHFELATGKAIHTKELFTKDGLSRKLLCDGQFIYSKDFCTFSILDAHSLSVIFRCELGDNLSSDICDLCQDRTHVYASLRGGGLAIINKARHEVLKIMVTDHSLWCIEADKRHIYGGGVNGRFFVLDKNTLLQRL